ncbi:MAG: hypothetical protein ACOYL8_00305 [Patescibacteria group bacterium]
MKKLRAFRHSLKEGNFISENGYILINANKEKFPKTNLIFTSSYTRTVQTACAILEIIKMPKHKLMIIESLGCENVEDRICRNKIFLELYRENPDEEIYQLLKKSFSENEISEMEKDCFLSIWSCFARMKDDETAIAIGHSFFISMAANHVIGQRKYGNMEELDYIDFEKEDEEITVKF